MTPTGRRPPRICGRCGRIVLPQREVQADLATAKATAEADAREANPKHESLASYELKAMNAITSIAARALACHARTCAREDPWTSTVRTGRETHTGGEGRAEGAAAGNLPRHPQEAT